MTRRIEIIHDGDHGTDDMICSIALLGYPDRFRIIGLAACHGNTGVDQVAVNILRTLEFSSAPDIPVYVGSPVPLEIPPQFGDNAFGKDGLGGVELPATSRSVAGMRAVDWYCDALKAPKEQITVVVTGPCTNLALALTRAPEIANGIRELVVMGGCLDPLQPGGRTGNITEHAEFNFFMCPDSASLLLTSGLNVRLTLFPLDVTHQLVFTPERQNRVRELFTADLAGPLIQLMRTAEGLDKPKFRVTGAFIHDAHCALYLLQPELYEFTRETVDVVTDPEDEKQGQLFRTDRGKNVKIARALKDPDAAFHILLDAIQRGLATH